MLGQSEPELPALKEKLLIMASRAEAAVNRAVKALMKRDASKARAVIPRDVEVDALNKEFHRELTGYMAKDPATITRCLNLMVIAKSLERIADHATNVAEEVVYLYEGNDIRHSGIAEKGQAAGAERQRP